MRTAAGFSASGLHRYVGFSSRTTWPRRGRATERDGVFACVLNHEVADRTYAAFSQSACCICSSYSIVNESPLSLRVASSQASSV
jgi:hypothetical protein